MRLHDWIAFVSSEVFFIMKEIQLSKRGKNRGKYVALVDDEDYERINQFNWCAVKMGNSIYAVRNVRLDVNTRKTIYMQWEIMGGKSVDHIFGVGLNNQKSNLRFCTKQQNSMNNNPYKNSSSKYKGVSWFKQTKKWMSNIRINNKQIYLGLFVNEIDAANMYDTAAKKYFGEFARLNFNN